MAVNHEAIQLAARARALTLEVCTTDGDYSRASTATYVNASGVVTTAAVDEARTAHYVNGIGPSVLYEAAATNLLLRSDEFDHATWAKSATGAASAPVVTANAATAPDNTATADSVVFVAPGAGDTSSLTQSSLTTVAASVYTGSIWIRAAAAGDIGKVILFRHVGANAYLSVTLSATWTRVTRTETAAGTSSQFQIDLRPTLGSSSGTVTVHLWRGQLELGASATSEIQTTSATATRAADVGGLTATGSTYTRTVGSFVTDGFRVGMEVTPSGFSDTTPRVITQVEALTLTVDGTPTAQTVSGGRTLTVGLPSTAVYENRVSDPTATVPYWVENYLPGASEKYTVAQTGSLEVLPLYVLQLYARMDVGIGALAKTADALLAHFAPGTALALTTGDTAVVRGRPAPTRSQLTNPDSGWALVTVTIPLRCSTANAI